MNEFRCMSILSLSSLFLYLPVYLAGLCQQVPALVGHHERVQVHANLVFHLSLFISFSRSAFLEIYLSLFLSVSLKTISLSLSLWLLFYIYLDCLCVYISLIISLSLLQSSSFTDFCCKKKVKIKFIKKKTFQVATPAQSCRLQTARIWDHARVQGPASGAGQI